MDKIAKRLKVYIDTHSFDPGDSDCETVLDQLYQAYAESMKVTRQRSAMDLMNWKNFYAISPWKRTTPSSTYAAASAAHTNIKLLLTE